MLAAIAWLLALGLVTSCSAGDEGSALEPARTASTPTASPMPTYPAAGKVQTPAGAEAAFRHYVDSYTWAFAHADPQPLIGLTVKGCVFCDSVLKNARDAQADGERTRGGAMVIHGLVVTPGNIPTEVLLGLNMSQNGAVTLGREGTPVATTSPDPQMHVDVLMRWVENRWLVADVAF